MPIASSESVKTQPRYPCCLNLETLGMLRKLGANGVYIHTYLKTPYRLLLFVGRIDVGMVGIYKNLNSFI